MQVTLTSQKIIAAPHLGDLGVQTLAHLHAPMRHQNRAVCVDCNTKTAQESGALIDSLFVNYHQDNFHTKFSTRLIGS